MDHQSDYKGSTVSSGQPVISKIEQLREKLKNIARLAYKVDDVLFCLSSSRNVLQEHNKTIESAEASVASHFATDLPTADCLDSLPGLLDTYRNQVNAANIAIQEEEEKISSGSRHIDSAIEQLTHLTADLETYVNDISEPAGHRKIVTTVLDAKETALTMTTMLKSMGGSGTRTTGRSKLAGKSSGIQDYFKVNDATADSPVDISFDKRRTRNSGGRLASKGHRDLFLDSDEDKQIKMAKEISARDAAAQGYNDSNNDYWPPSTADNDRVTASRPSAGSRLLAIDQQLSRITQHQEAPSPNSQDDDENMVITSTVRPTKRVIMSQEETTVMKGVQNMCSPDTRNRTVDPEVMYIGDDDIHDHLPQSAQAWEAQTSNAPHSYSGRHHFSSSIQQNGELDSPSDSGMDTSFFEYDSGDAAMFNSDSESESELSSSAHKRKQKSQQKQSHHKSSKKSKTSERARKSRKVGEKDMLTGKDSLPFSALLQEGSKIKSPTGAVRAAVQAAEVLEVLEVGETPSSTHPRLGRTVQDWMSTAVLHSDGKPSARSRGGSSVGLASPEFAHKYPAPDPVAVTATAPESAVEGPGGPEGPDVRGSGTQSDDGESSEGEDKKPPSVAPTKHTQPTAPWPQKVQGLDRFKCVLDDDQGAAEVGTGFSAQKRAIGSSAEGTVGPFSRITKPSAGSAMSGKLSYGDGEMSQLQKSGDRNKQALDVVDLT